MLCGALLSSLSITLLFFGRLLPLDGRLGFVVVWFAVFLVIYGLLVSITDNRPAVVDRVMAALMTSAALIAGVALIVGRRVHAVVRDARRCASRTSTPRT